MHAPDGLFSLPVNVVFAVVVFALVAASCRVLSRRQDHRLVPLMGLLAAFVFAGQMVNFPIASGTTGHLLGGTLAAILVGPWAGTVVMAAVIVFQALLGDGGLTVLGPNIFNMGIVGTCLAYFVYRAFVGRAFERPTRIVAASFFAAWVAVPLASVFVSLQLAVSGTASLSRVLPAMVLTHMAIGIGEALITAGVVAFVLKTRPELLYDRPGGAGERVGRLTLTFGLAGALVVATCLSLLPRLWDYPDGLEYVGLVQGFLAEEARAAGDGSLALLPDYTVPGLSGIISTSVAGAIGTLVMFVGAMQVGRVLMRPRAVRG
jgi:cobalt/nickel transport system permease protein